MSKEIEGIVKGYIQGSISEGMTKEIGSMSKVVCPRENVRVNVLGLWGMSKGVGLCEVP